MTSDALCRENGPAAGSPSRVSVSNGPTYVGLAERDHLRQRRREPSLFKARQHDDPERLPSIRPVTSRPRWAPHPARCSSELSRYPAPFRVLQSRSSPSDGHELLAHTTPLNSRDVIDGRFHAHRWQPTLGAGKMLLTDFCNRITSIVHLFGSRGARGARFACASGTPVGELPPRATRVVERLTAPYELRKKSGITLG